MWWFLHVVQVAVLKTYHEARVQIHPQVLLQFQLGWIKYILVCPFGLIPTNLIISDLITIYSEDPSTMTTYIYIYIDSDMWLL